MTRNNSNLHQISISYTSILWWEIRAIQTKTCLTSVSKDARQNSKHRLFSVLGEPNSKIDYNLEETERDAFSRRFDEASSNLTKCHWPMFNVWDSSCKDTTAATQGKKKMEKNPQKRGNIKSPLLKETYQWWLWESEIQEYTCKMKLKSEEWTLEGTIIFASRNWKIKSRKANPQH